MVTKELAGAQLVYKNAPQTCADGSPMTFTIKAYCDANLTVANTYYNPVMDTEDPCNPSVYIVSQIGGCDLLQRSEIYEYLDLAAPYLGAVAIGFGVLLTFLGLKLVRPSLFVIGLLAGTIVGVFLYYTISLTGT